MVMNYKVALAAGILALGAQGALADPVKLIFASESPGGSPNAAYFQQWVDKVNAAGKGIVEVELRDGESIANFGNVYDRIQDDVIQIGWMLPGLYGAKFPLTEVSSLPFLSNDNVACSAAFWRMYQNGIFKEEYKDIQPLWFGCADVTYMHFAKPPKGVDDLAGIKMRVKSKSEGRLVELMGGTGISMPGGEMYQALQRGTVDAINTGWAGFPSYKLNEVTSFHLEVPIGMALTTHFMSRKKFDSLPKEAQDILLKAGGEARSKEMGQYFNIVADKARAEAVSLKHEIVQLKPEQLANWKARSASLVDEWIKGRTGGQEVLDAFNKALAEVGKAN